MELMTNILDRYILPFTAESKSSFECYLEAEGGRGMGKTDGSYIQIQIHVIKMTERSVLDCGL